MKINVYSCPLSLCSELVNQLAFHCFYADVRCEPCLTAAFYYGVIAVDSLAVNSADYKCSVQIIPKHPFLDLIIVIFRPPGIIQQMFFLRCFTCMAERASTFTRRCTVNPLIGREDEGLGEIQPAPVKRKVLVVGGGPGGLYAAYTAARRGHQVILCEAGDRCGGLLIGESAVPPIPGLRESRKMVVAEDYHLKANEIGQKVIVLGGGLVGCELAAVLGDLGKEVHVVEMRDTLCPDANVRYRPLLMKKLEETGVHIHTSSPCQSVNDDGILCKDANGDEFQIHGDSIICALGLKAKKDVVEELRGLTPQFASIGNCVKPNTITYAVYQGYHAALDIH